MKTIIVATDYSDAANNALQYAAQLASIVEADLVLFNAYHLPVHASNALMSPVGIDHMMANNEHRLKQLAAETARKYHLNVKWETEMAATLEALEGAAKAYRADLIVMGTESNLLEDKIFGNTTTAAIRRLHFPILVVPSEAAFKGIHNILFACEYTYLDENNTLDLMKEFARKFNAKLQVYHVETKEKALEPMVLDTQIILAMDEKLAAVEHGYSYTEEDSIGAGIAKGIQAFQADLLVMVPHKAGFMESLLKGSTTRRMALKTQIPLLVLPN